MCGGRQDCRSLSGAIVVLCAITSLSLGQYSFDSHTTIYHYISQFGTTILNAQVEKLYNKSNKDGQKMEKGVAFPVCISVNDVVCNHSPLKSEELVRYCRLCFRA